MCNFFNLISLNYLKFFWPWGHIDFIYSSTQFFHVSKYHSKWIQSYYSDYWIFLNIINVHIINFSWGKTQISRLKELLLISIYDHIWILHGNQPCNRKLSILIWHSFFDNGRWHVICSALLVSSLSIAATFLSLI